MCKYVNVYVSILVVVAKDVVSHSYVVLAATVAVEVCFSVRNKFHPFLMFVCNKFMCPNRLIFVMFLFVKLLL